MLRMKCHLIITGFDVGSWPIASFRGNAAFRSLSEHAQSPRQIEAFNRWLKEDQAETEAMPSRR
jgi:hypothetical protein